jgi:hypothetical protein
MGAASLDLDARSMEASFVSALGESNQKVALLAAMAEVRSYAVAHPLKHPSLAARIYFIYERFKKVKTALFQFIMTVFLTDFYYVHLLLYVFSSSCHPSSGCFSKVALPVINGSGIKA